MAEVGFARAGDAWRWRGRRGRRARPPRRPLSHAFAELAKLKQASEDRPLPALHPPGEEPHARPGASIEQGHVRIDGKRVEKPSEEVRVGSVVALPLRGQVRVLRVSRCPSAAARRPKPAPATRSWELTSAKPAT